ncbi:GumC family protein [Siphonobacter aquaeclarae]|uniref:Capsular exopolysaccharide family n=1 Tax=Siphonobacter aquaeclarae TaxID=563176 RepID=A0A1G9V6C5_9BACT|nr:tyrosine-protein kinase [Siphonobacter aquaeclarae]SDM67738.1 capsular exopolysaccharide family [Siphonobacter aquaeclarae]
MATNNAYSSYVPYTVVETDQTNIRAILFRYVRNWPWFLASIVVALGAAYVYMLYQQPIFRVQASLLVKDEKKGVDTGELMKQLDIFGQQKLVDNEIEILKSYTLMDKIVGDLNLDVTYFAPTNFGKREVYGDVPVRIIVEKATPELYKTELNLSFPDARTIRINDQNFPLNQSVQTPYGRIRFFAPKPVTNAPEKLIAVALPRAKAVENYLKAFTAETASKQSTVIQLTILDAVPAKGEAILNRLIDEYNAAAVEDKNKTASNTLKFLDERLGLVSGELQTVEKNVEQYKTAQGITDLSAQAQSFLQTVQQNDAQLNEVGLQLGAIQDVERYVNSRSQERAGAPSTLGLSDPVLLGLITKVSELELQREQLARTTSEQNPMLQSLESQIRTTKANIKENIQTTKTMLNTSKTQLMATNRKLEGVIRSIPQKERSLIDISRQQAIKNNLYTFLLQKREETAVSYACTIADSRTVDPARSSNEPVRPVAKVIFALFCLVGLVIPAGAITAKDALNNRVMRRTDVEEVTQVPILGEVVKSKDADRLIMAPQNRSVISEQIRTIRTNLQFLKSATDSQVLLFTSSISGEGKSFVSLNLGASLALVDRPTVILEMDLRKPKLREALGMTNGIGISNYLIGEATLDEALHPIPGYENYYIMPSGPIPPNPSELLSSQRLEQLFVELRERFNYVIVDSPPIGLVTDAQLIAPFADSTMYMVRHDVTPKNYLKMIDTLYKEQRFQKLNIILNGVGEGEAYYYSYSYGYYGDEKGKQVQS